MRLINQVRLDLLEACPDLHFLLLASLDINASLVSMYSLLPYHRDTYECQDRLFHLSRSILLLQHMFSMVHRTYEEVFNYQNINNIEQQE